MPTKCDCCGLETNLEAAFFKQRKSFSRTIRTFCPACWLDRQQSTYKRHFFATFGWGLLGLLVVKLWPAVDLGWVFLNLFVFQLALMVSILPHEFGHAFAARWMRMRVFKIYLGSGKTLIEGHWLGFDVELKSIPMGGLVLAGMPTIERFRRRKFAYVLAGPAMNFLMAAATLPFLVPDHLWRMSPFEQGVQLGLTFFYANLAILVENLLPRRVPTPLGTFETDGKQLLQLFSNSMENREALQTVTFTMEATLCHRKGDYATARVWIEKGLTLYPTSESLLSWQGVSLLETGEYRAARECFQKMLLREGAPPLTRAIMKNNIAYADALLGGEELHAEADQLSREALADLGWLASVKGTRGTVMVMRGELEEGIRLLHESMSQADQPNQKAQTACILAEAEAKRGNIELAQRFLEEAQRLAPHCHLIKRAEAALR